ncbi:MAG: AMP-binding protein, partial [Deltaproteobacteria bacterium]|nr:AMP-binding protein [Deltaproteobacteria bacterium]
MSSLLPVNIYNSKKHNSQYTSQNNIVDTSLTTNLQYTLNKDLFHFPGNLAGLLDRSLELYPDRDGIGVPGQLLTFKEYYDHVCRMVHGLQKIGLERNDRVLFISHNSLNYAFISLAVFRIGAVLVPANPRIRHYELAHMLSETHPKFIICESSNIETALKAYTFIQKPPSACFITIDKKVPSTIFIKDLDLSKALTHYEIMAPDDTAMIVYTAAMDGYPLGAELTHASIFYDTVFFAERAFKDNASPEVLSSILPLFHCFGFTVGFLMPVMDSYQVTQITSVPAILFSMMKPLSEKPNLCARLNNIASGGIKIPMNLLKKYHDQLGLTINEGYGLTEASPAVTWNRIERPSKFGTAGYPLACCQVKIVDDTGKELPPGHEGEILVRGLNIFTRYLNQPTHTQNAFINDWFKTGDLGHLDNENYLTLTGLKKDMINIFGLKVYPKEVERILLYHPDIQSVRIWGELHQKYGDIVACEVFLKSG